MATAEQVTANCIEGTFRGNAAYRKLGEGVYIVKQGSTYVMMHIVGMGAGRARVRCIAQLVKGVDMTPELSLELLKLNASLRFGAFAYSEPSKLVLITHSLLGGETLDPEELEAALQDVALLADEHDDRIIERFGGQLMSDLLEASKLGELFRGVNTTAF